MTATPRSTYRLQLNGAFTLADAAAWVRYLRTLGADWVYCSPVLTSEPGSDHGYDVIDHSRTDAERGGRAGLARLADAAHTAGLGVLADIVPNHVGIATPMVSLWWRDVLTYGAGSRHASAFDIDWQAGAGRIRLPILGGDDGELGELRIDADELRYYEHRLPIAPGTAGGSPREVHARQHYELVNYRLADTELNYRRFFAVNTLAGIRVEDPAVFAASHAEIAHWIESGWVDGLRVDHPDGLTDPAAYLRDLAGLTGGRYTVVEKILEPGEQLPTDWRCAGTTGYDTLAEIDRILIDPAGRTTLTSLDTRLRQEPADWPDLVHDSKRAVADGILGSEIRRLARLVSHIAPFEILLDALAELIACFPVYRSYLPTGGKHLDAALSEAARRRPDLTSVLEVLGHQAKQPETEFSVRLQQTTGAVMAKGVEDCAFYRYSRLASLTEVGGDPAVFSLSSSQFHATQRRRLAHWPNTMTTLSTHDTKRGEDVRARIDVLAEIPDDWATALARWLDLLDFPDPVLGNLLFQTIVGAWPIEPDRLHGYAVKAAREAGMSTGWLDPDAAFEDRLHALADACHTNEVVATELAAFAHRIRGAGWSNSLAAKLLQLTVPGVPDVYRGTELWRNDLVDPDNRRPFDALAPGGAADLLTHLDTGWLPPIDETGAAKLLVTSRALRARRDRPELFIGYWPITPSGPAAEHAIAFDRGGAVTVATRLPIGLASRGGWRETAVSLPPGRWRDALTGAEFTVPGTDVGEGVVMVGEVLSRYPVALLLRPERATP